MFVNCNVIIDYFSSGVGVGQWTTNCPLSSAVIHTHREPDTNTHMVKCQNGLSGNKRWHPCRHYLWKACQRHFCANTNEVTWLTELWALCHPRSDRVRRGQRYIVYARVCVCMYLCLVSAVNIVHFISLHATQASCQEHKQTGLKRNASPSNADLFNYYQENLNLCIWTSMGISPIKACLMGGKQEWW